MAPAPAARLRALSAAARELVAPDAAADLRVRAPEARRNWVRVRIDHADSLDVAALCRRFPEALVHVRAAAGDAALDVYLPRGALDAAGALEALARALAALALAALVLGLAFAQGGIAACGRGAGI